MIYKDKYCEQFINSYAKATVDFAQSAACSILGIWDFIHYNFYCINASDYVSKIKVNLHNQNFLDAIKAFQSSNYFELLNESRFVELKIRLFDYYFSRLPVLRFATFDGKYRLSIDDINAISNLSFIIMDTKYNNEMKKYKFSGLYEKFMSFSRYPKTLRHFYLHKIDDLLYDYTWLFDFFQSYYPEYLSDNNINNFATYVLESCFPIFWDTFSEKVIESLIVSINFGYINGTKDIQELISKDH